MEHGKVVVEERPRQCFPEGQTPDAEHFLSLCSMGKTERFERMWNQNAMKLPGAKHFYQDSVVSAAITGYPILPFTQILDYLILLL